MYYVDYNSGIYDPKEKWGYTFGPSWIGMYAQYAGSQSAYYRDNYRKSDRRLVEKLAREHNYKRPERYVDPWTGRAKMPSQ